MKTVAILGSTGSIGKNTLKVIAQLKDKFKVVGLVAGSNSRLFAKQINEFRPRVAAIADESKYPYLRKSVTKQTKLLCGQKAIEEVASCGADIVVIAIAGTAALVPTLKALDKTKRIALANKECLVMAGEEIMRKVKAKKAQIIPVDSEHSAIFQCLKDEKKQALSKIYLTGSGGPLKDVAFEDLESVTPEFALRHPKWRMGKKISIDSATLVNKGFEVIEAKYLFDLPAENIKIIIHPEAIVHSLVEFVDGTILAQLGKTDMRIPIQYALTYPERLEARLSRMDFSKISKLSFQQPNIDKFPALRLSMQVAKDQGLSGAVFSSADEECVFAYLNKKIKFTDIVRIIEEVLTKLKNKPNPTIEEIIETDRWAREQVKIRI